MHTVLSLVLIGYGLVSAFHDDLYIPGKRSRGMHLHGEPMWVMLGFFFCASCNPITVVLDHYDRRDNERHYRTFARFTQVLGWSLFGLAIVLDIFVFHN